MLMARYYTGSGVRQETNVQGRHMPDLPLPSGKIGAGHSKPRIRVFEPAQISLVTASLITPSAAEMPREARSVAA